MRISFTRKLICALALITAAQANAQAPKATWGNDVIVAPVAGEHYKNTRVTVGYDGAIYVGRLKAVDASSPYQRWEVLKSTDTGHTFTLFTSNQTGTTNSYHAFDIIAAGANATDFRLFVARSLHDSSTGINVVTMESFNTSGSYVDRQVSNVDTYAGALNNRGVESLSLASDWKEPNSTSTPYNISLAAVKTGPVNDSIIVWASGDAGTTMHRRSLYGTNVFLRNVSSATGSTVSATSTYGRIALAWDEYATGAAEWGKINCQFVYGDDAGTPPANTGVYQIGNTATNYRKPSVCLSQQTGTVTGNGAKDIVMMICYETNNVTGGFTSLNFRMIDSLVYKPFNAGVGTEILGSGGLDVHTMYDPNNNNYMVTYYDSNAQALVYSLKSLSSPLSNPLTIFKSNYRDATTNLGIPVYPRVDINTANHQAVFVWNDNYKSMLDAEYAVLPSSVQSVLSNVSDVQVFPNPVNDNVNIGFVATEADDVTVSISDVSGRRIKNTKANVSSGLNKISLDANELPTGNYFIEVKGTVLNFNARFVKQ